MRREEQKAMPMTDMSSPHRWNAADQDHVQARSEREYVCGAVEKPHTYWETWWKEKPKQVMICALLCVMVRESSRRICLVSVSEMNML